MASNELIRQTEIRVGAVVLVGIILLILGVTFGRGVSVSPNVSTLHIHFPTAAGIESSAPVFVHGVKRGAVSKVAPDAGGVMIDVNMDDVSDLRSDVAARITILELTGGKKIEIVPGTAAQAWSGGVIQGTSAPDFGDLMTFVGDVSGTARTLLQRLDTMSASLNKLVGDSSFVNDIKQTAGNANEAVAALKSVLVTNRENLQVSLQNLRSISQDLQRMVKENDTTVTALLRKVNAAASSTQKILVSADSTIVRVDRLMTDINDVVLEIKKGDGTIGRLIYDKNMGARLDSALTTLGSFVDAVSKHGVNVNVRLGTRP
jgi:phospholipid/cholesterol/gamma-HCH transport system substrate-binding protein